jgi:hypothetical protein
MSNMVKLECEGYDEFWLDLDLVASVGIGNVGAQSPLGGNVIIKATIVSTAAGGKIVFSDKVYNEILQGKINGKVKDPNDIDIPDSFFDAWDSKDGDDDEKEKVDTP